MRIPVELWQSQVLGDPRRIYSVSGEASETAGNKLRRQEPMRSFRQALHVYAIHRSVVSHDAADQVRETACRLWIEL